MGAALGGGLAIYVARDFNGKMTSLKTVRWLSILCFLPFIK